MQIKAEIETLEGWKPFVETGRRGWLLKALIEAADNGITTLECPAARISSYVHRLRKAGIAIDTEMEPHGGPYSGRHARFRLTSRIRLVEGVQ